MGSFGCDPRVGGQYGEGVRPDDQRALALRRCGRALGDLVEDVGELVAEEDRDDGRRRLVGAEPVIIGGRRDGRPQQPAELVHRPDHGGAEHQELGVVMRIVAGQQQVSLGGVAQREVDVLARAVDPVERLLVEQAFHTVLLGDRLERRHQQLLMIRRDVGPLEHRRDLELAGGHLVVPGLRRDPQLEQLPLGVHHEAENALRDGPEVMVIEFLALRRFRPEKGATGVQQVRPGQEEVPVDEEVLLFGATVGHHPGRGVTEEP